MSERVVCCLICGIHKDKAAFPNCGPDAERHGVQLAKGVPFGPHIWREALIVNDYFGKSISEMMGWAVG